jgi:hypothetical protein
VIPAKVERVLRTALEEREGTIEIPRYENRGSPTQGRREETHPSVVVPMKKMMGKRQNILQKRGHLRLVILIGIMRAGTENILDPSDKMATRGVIANLFDERLFIRAVRFMAGASRGDLVIIPGAVVACEVVVTMEHP